MSLWEDVVNEKTGEHSLKEHELKVVKVWCHPTKHIFEITGNRTLKCKKCGQEVEYILGKQQLVDGHLVENQ